MVIAALDKKINIKMFVESMFDRFKIFLASQLTPEEKLQKITEELAKDVQEKRILARQIGAHMRAIADPTTKDLEPLEALRARREKLIAFGAKIVNDSSKAAQLGQLQQEIKALDPQISAQDATLQTLRESYRLAKANYQEAFNALETVRRNAPAMLKAIQAHKDALEQRDKVRDSKKIDTKFLNELTTELSQVKAELRSDKEIEKDLDGTNAFSLDKELAKMDKQTQDDQIMAELKAVAAAKK